MRFVKEIENGLKGMDGSLRRINCGIRLCDFTGNEDMVGAFSDTRGDVVDVSGQGVEEGQQHEEEHSDS